MSLKTKEFFLQTALKSLVFTLDFEAVFWRYLLKLLFKCPKTLEQESVIFFSAYAFVSLFGLSESNCLSLLSIASKRDTIFVCNRLCKSLAFGSRSWPLYLEILAQRDNKVDYQSLRKLLIREKAKF